MFPEGLTNPFEFAAEADEIAQQTAASSVRMDFLSV
jgi:hypothetical protein